MSTTRSYADTVHHYAEVGTLAVCGRPTDGTDHMTHTARVVIGLARSYRPNAMGRHNICPVCLAVAQEVSGVPGTLTGTTHTKEA